jgi:outer membrane protein assembly factor BamB
MRAILPGLLFVLLICWIPTALASEADKPPTCRLLSCLDVKDFGAETLRIGDLDGDGGPELLLTQCVYGPREITCLTAVTLFGEVLWQHGSPSAGNGRVYCDLPVQIYDWDHDGRNEVLYVRQARYAEPPDQGGIRERASRYEGHATLVVLDGRTGKEKATLSLPAPADDSLAFADLTGRGRREDLVVKDRYWNMWGVAHDGRELWHWAGSTGHYPAIADIDGDGRDEVFVGFALVDHDGRVLFEKDPHGGHQDACYIVRPGDGRYRLLFGNGGIHCLATDGTELWHHPLGEAQHVVAGRFRTDSELQYAVVDRTPVSSHRRDENAWGILYLYDPDGKEIWRRQQEKGAWCIATLRLNWFGRDGADGIFVYGHGQDRPAVLYNGQGDIIEQFPMVYAPGVERDPSGAFYGLVADVWGDEREEVLIFNSRGTCIYTNPRPLEKPTLYNETLYPGM